MSIFVDNVFTIELLIILTIINNLFAIKYPFTVICILSLIYALYINITYVVAIFAYSIIIYKRKNVYLAGGATLLCLSIAIFMNYAYDYYIDQILIYVYFSLKLYSVYNKKSTSCCLLPFTYSINLYNDLQTYDHIIIYSCLIFIYVTITEIA
jgi:hypothetical protein